MRTTTVDGRRVLVVHDEKARRLAEQILATLIRINAGLRRKKHGS